MATYDLINQFLLTCGAVDDLYQFVKTTLDGLKAFCDYDQATAYLFDGNSKVADRYLVNIDKKQSDIFQKYYFHTLKKTETDYTGRPGKSARTVKSNKPKVCIITWGKLPADDFIRDYINPRGIKHSAYVFLTDSHNALRATLAMDRTQDKPFSATEVKILNYLFPHLNNLHRKFFLIRKDTGDRKQALMEMAGLTARESEIAILLCNGVSPANISSTLHIAPATTHKHITHIYEKMHVSNLQELLVYLLNSEGHEIRGST